MEVVLDNTLSYVDDEHNFDDDDNNDDDDDNSSNSVNFQARTSIFCMEVDLHNTCNMILMKMMIIMMMKMIIALT